MARAVLNRLNFFFKNIYLDYRRAFDEARESARKRPICATIYGASTLFCLNLFRTNEGLRSYSSEVISACNRVASVSENCRNPESYRFVRTVGEYNCNGLLRQLDLGFSTLIYKADSNPEVALFRYNCPYMRPSIKEFFQERIVDWGLLGHWLMLEIKMHDYDINEEEYKGLGNQERFLGPITREAQLVATK